MLVLYHAPGTLLMDARSWKKQTNDMPPATTQRKKFAGAFVVIAALVVIAPFLWGYLNGCNYQFGRRLLFTAFTRNYVPDSSVEFKLLGSFDGRGPQGSAFESFEFHSTDCVDLRTEYLAFGMESDAEDAMTRQINSAKRIVAPISQVRSNPDMSHKGDRAVIFDGWNYVILRRFGAKLHTITSSSLNHALEFERRGHFELETLE